MSVLYVRDKDGNFVPIPALKGADGKDGVDGQPGQDGYTPVKGVDYFDGQPGKDGVDGKDGNPGADGYTPVKGKDYFDGQPGKDGQDGSPGKDGTSATHSWNGTVLTITSASGTSSADLKGDKGDKGDTGEQGIQGEKGETGTAGADGAKGDKGDKGDTGADGVSPTVSVSKSGKVTTVSITDKNGTKTATINDGADGSPGSAGKDGTSVTVQSVSESSADGGSNVVTFSDGKTLTVKNGKTGATGAKGADGTTPVRGTDYWTDADQESIVQQVIAALGTPVFGRVDADKNIILTGELADGTYTIKYEDANGELTDIGTFDVGGVDNLADPNSSDWVANKRLNSSGGLADASYNATYQGAVTNYIPCKNGDTVRVKGLDISHYYTNQDGGTGRTNAFFYADDKSSIIAKNIPADGNGWIYADGIWTYTVGDSLTAVSGSNSDIRYARLTGIYYNGFTANDVIITVNEEIP